jgi:putative colanic acid biosynthesis UDP-glucose lipid carrier transferase
LHKRNVRIEDILDRVFRLVLFQFAILTLITFFLNGTKDINLKFGLILFVLEFWAAVSWRMLMRQVIMKIRKRKENIRPIIILGSGNVASEIYQKIIKNPHNCYQLIGFFDDRFNDDEILIGQDSFKLKGYLQDVIPFLKENKIDTIFCALPAGEDRKAIPILNYAENNLIRFYFVPDFKRFLSKKVNLHFIDDIPIVSLRTEPLEYLPNRFIKRIFDFVLSLIFLITLFPILLIIVGLSIKLTTKGPVFFKQKRTGKKGEDFICIKFRSMNQNKYADQIQATKDDFRVTKVGAFLRKTNLDELPQFWNVLIGDMSIVGPRPHMIKHTDEYSALIDKYMLRHLAKPGITGWAQITGCRGETKDVREMERRVKRDVWYLENWTLWLDIKIIFQTVWLMLTGDDKAY